MIKTDIITLFIKSPKFMSINPVGAYYSSGRTLSPGLIKCYWLIFFHILFILFNIFHKQVFKIFKHIFHI